MKKNTVIFDLGGVILPLDTETLYKEFLLLTNKDIREWIKFSYPHHIIQQYELGKITEKEFFEELKEVLEYDKELYYLKEAWNSILLPIPKENILFLKELSKHYRLILLSNTCETHIRRFEEMLDEHHNIKSLEDLFDRVYFSCRIHLRKPDLKIFQKIIKDNALNAPDTFYFDDTETHIDAAKKLNINALLYPQNQILPSILKKFIPVMEKI